MKTCLRRLRAETEWTQADLAERLGVSRQTINAIEIAKYGASLPLPIKIARLFDKAVEEVSLLGVGPPRNSPSERESVPSAQHDNWWTRLSRKVFQF